MACAISNDVLIPRALLRAQDQFGGVIQSDMLRGTPIWENERLIHLDPPHGGTANMLIPKLVEAHVHLDKCHTGPRLGAIGGDLMAAITAQREDKANWTKDDIRARANRGLSEAREAGCRFIRTHVDWGDEAEPPLTWRILRDVPAPDLQLSALTGIGQMADPDLCRAIAGHIAQDNGVLGAFILHHDPEMVGQGLRNMFDAAQRHGLMLDFHVDEDLGDGNGLEAIADMALATGHDGPILCGHCVTLMNRNASEFARIADKLARAAITVCALPNTNLYLQGRTEGTPDRRGLTRLRELHDAGVSIIVGSDNVADAFCPTGQHDPMAALNLAVLTGHLDPPLNRWLPLVTTNAARALGQDPIFVDGASKSDLLTSSAQTTAELITGRATLTGVPPT